jgi:hypothetical protein
MRLAAAETWEDPIHCNSNIYNNEISLFTRRFRSHEIVKPLAGLPEGRSRTRFRRLELTAKCNIIGWIRFVVTQ